MAPCCHHYNIETCPLALKKRCLLGVILLRYGYCQQVYLMSTCGRRDPYWTCVEWPLHGMPGAQWGNCFAKRTSKTRTTTGPRQGPSSLITSGQRQINIKYPSMKLPTKVHNWALFRSFVEKMMGNQCVLHTGYLGWKNVHAQMTRSIMQKYLYSVKFLFQCPLA